MKMKYPLLFTAIGLSLAACSEKPPEKAATPVATPAAGFAKAVTERPAVIQSMQDLPNSCALDSVDDQLAKDVSSSDKTKIKLGGWAGNVPAGTSPKQVFVEFDGPRKVYVQAAHGIKRPDVADHFKKPGLADTGWVANADLSDVAVGTYKVRIIQVEGQTGLVCDSRKSIVLN
jgi:hypothetical protein